MENSKTTYTPNQENLTEETLEFEVYHYCDEFGKPVFLTKEVYKKEKRIVFFPYVYIGYSGPSLSLEYGPPVSVITGQQL
ncbi:hypothetical protein [Sphingobacterium sp. BIGb0165]|uniref:hypothetical protein n=1 Tax=Sphingobacterium sp. BIGb0165 TaxID=2940615 RepID=UPI00216A78BB|nr:hypothetical protein [Sphingobacterium sp. BIGb0165]MCS4224716.1 hypothetical protein [Sphingobacterium sp. BIGb0165]